MITARIKRLEYDFRLINKRMRNNRLRAYGIDPEVHYSVEYEEEEDVYVFRQEQKKFTTGAKSSTDV